MHISASSTIVLMALGALVGAPLLVASVLILRRGLSTRRARLFFVSSVPALCLFVSLEVIGVGLLAGWQSWLFRPQAFVWSLVLLFAAWLIGLVVFRMQTANETAQTQTTKTP